MSRKKMSTSSRVSTESRKGKMSSLDAVLSGQSQNHGSSDMREFQSLLMQQTLKMHEDMKHMGRAVDDFRTDVGLWQSHQSTILGSISRRLGVDGTSHGGSGHPNRPAAQPSLAEVSGVSGTSASSTAMSQKSLVQMPPDATLESHSKEDDIEKDHEQPTEPRTSLSMTSITSVPPLFNTPDTEIDYRSTIDSSPSAGSARCSVSSLQSVQEQPGMPQRTSHRLSAPNVTGSLGLAPLSGHRLSTGSRCSRASNQSASALSAQRRDVFEKIKRASIVGHGRNSNASWSGHSSWESERGSCFSGLSRGSRGTRQSGARRASGQSVLTRAATQEESVWGGSVSDEQDIEEAYEHMAVNLEIDKLWLDKPAKSRATTRGSVAEYSNVGPGPMAGERAWGQAGSMESNEFVTLAQHWRRLKRGDYMLAPGTGKRTFWDVLTGFVLAFEAVYTPFSICFNPPDSFLAKLFRVATTIFWIADLILNFFTGYTQDGELVRDPLAAAWRYARTWLAFDILLVSLDLSYLFAENAMNTGFLGDILRLARLVRLLRLVKLKRIIQDMTSRINNNNVLLVFAIAFRFILVMSLAHGMACGWYLCASLYFGSGITWVQVYVPHEDYLYEKYVISLHWAISQMHGSIEVSPQNVVERTYAVACLVLSLFVVAVLVGNFASFLSNLLATQNHRTQQLWLLRRYLQQLQISDVVSKKVDTYAQYVLDKQIEEVSGDSVHVLKFLPDGLSAELKADSYVRYIRKHALFAFSYLDRSDTVVLIVDALSTSWMSAGDYVFMCGDVHVDVVLLVDGSGKYCSEGSQFPDPQDVHLSTVCDCGHFFVNDEVFCFKCGKRRQQTGPEDLHSDGLGSFSMETSKSGSSVVVPGERVPDGVWISEPALWVNTWIALGDLEVNEACQLAQLNSKKFKKAVRKQRWLWDMMAQYANTFVNTLNNTSASHLTDLSYKFTMPETTVRDAELEHEVVAPPRRSAIRLKKSKSGRESALEVH